MDDHEDRDLDSEAEEGLYLQTEMIEEMGRDVPSNE